MFDIVFYSASTLLNVLSGLQHKGKLRENVKKTTTKMNCLSIKFTLVFELNKLTRTKVYIKQITFRWNLDYKSSDGSSGTIYVRLLLHHFLFGHICADTGSF